MKTDPFAHKTCPHSHNNASSHVVRTPKERTFGKSVHAKRTRERERGGEEDGPRRGDGARGAILSSAIPSLDCSRRLGVMETVEKAVVASGLPFFHQYLPISKLRAVREPFDSDKIEQVSAKSSVGGEKQNPFLVSVGFGIVSLFFSLFFGIILWKMNTCLWQISWDFRW